MKVNIDFSFRKESIWKEQTIHLTLIPENTEDNQLIEKLSERHFVIDATFLELYLKHGEGIVFSRPGCFPILSRS